MPKQAQALACTHAELDDRSKELRREIVRTMGAGGRGHLAPALSLVEILRVLYDDILRHSPKNPDWRERDRLILSKGHGCIALYVLLADKGYFPASELNNFCGFDSMLGGHPERAKVPGVEASTGSLGHGLPLGLGMALRARMDGDPCRVFVIVGDGESNEGSVWESALIAGKHKLENLVVLVDYNKMQSCGWTDDIQGLEPLKDKWRAFGFHALEVDGHDVDALGEVLTNIPGVPGKPTAIICHTIKGRGIKGVECDLSWHHRSKLDEATQAMLLEGIGEACDA